MIAALIVWAVLAGGFAVLAWVADRTEPDRKLYVVDDRVVRRIGGREL